MRSMGEVRVHATEKVCALKHPPHPTSPTQWERMGGPDREDG